MLHSTHTVQGVEVFVDGDAAETVLMVHGWPDTHRLWDGTVQALKADLRCIRFTLPGFDIAGPSRPTSLERMEVLFLDILDALCPGQAVTLLLHDWGCIFGYEFAARHPARVARIVAVDIGDHNSGALRRSLSAKATLQVVAYQLWLALAWKVGGATGDRMTRWMARALGCRTEPSTIGWQMNYPYAMKWFGAQGGLAGAARIDPQCPMLYIYGERKPFMFHSFAWLQRIAARPGSSVQAFATGHWVMVQEPRRFGECVREWLLQIGNAPSV